MRLRATLEAPNPRRFVADGLLVPEDAERPRGIGSPKGSRCRYGLGTLGECLQPVGNDLDSPSSAAIGGLPLTALESAFDVDEAATSTTVSLPDTNGWGFGTHRYDRGPLERLRRQQRPVAPPEGCRIR
jgi:hypothetical protein